jgi:uncharacterized protein
MNDKQISELLEKVKPYFGDSVAHGLDHTKKVLRNAMEIFEQEGGDADIIFAAAILHDIAKNKQTKDEVGCHAIEGAKMAKEILENYDFPKDKIDAVCYVIKVHRKSTNLKPETIEAAIIQDADRLDCLGIPLIIRFLLSAGKYGTPLYDSENKNKEEHWSKKPIINHIREKMEKNKPENFNTEHARHMAREKYDYTADFLNKFVKEWSVI